MFNNTSRLRSVAWAAALLIIGDVIWQRPALSAASLSIIFIFLGGGALWWDFKGASVPRLQKLRCLVTPLLLLISVPSVLFLLYHAWKIDLITTFCIGSLLPYSDADEFVNGAKSLITFGELGQWSARRPLGANLIAVALWATNQDYQQSLFLLALVTGAATFFAARQTWLTGGLFAAVIYVGLSLLVLLPSTVEFMSERAGYIFASMSYALFLSAFRRSSFSLSLVAFSLLVLAEAARPGPIFAVGMVGAYMIYFFSKRWSEAARKGLIVVAIGATIWAIGPLISLRIAPPGAQLEGAIPYTLYGLAAGGEPWDYIFTEHPEIFQLHTDKERSNYAYQLFREKFTARPTIFARAIIQRFCYAITHPGSVYFSLINDRIWGEIVAVFALIGFVLLLRPALGRTSAFAFLSPAMLGVVFSAPLLFDTGSRGYASIFPFQLGLIVVPFVFAVDWILTKWWPAKLTPHQRSDQHPISEIAFAVGITAAVTLIPLWISLTANPENISSAVQRSGLSSNEAVFYFNRQSGILIESKTPPVGVRNVSLASVTGLKGFARELDATYYIFKGDFLYHALLLVQPPSHGDIVVSYIIFDRVPDLSPGYLIATLHLVTQKGHVGLFKADDFRPLKL